MRMTKFSWQKIKMTNASFIDSTAQKINIVISHNKTQSMVKAKNPIRSKLMVKEHTIDQLMNFNYLK